MTKQEAIEKAWELLERLDALPDGVDVLTASAREYDVPGIHLSSGIEQVSRLLRLPVSTNTQDEFVHMTIRAENCYYVQLEEKEAAPSDATTGDGKA